MDTLRQIIQVIVDGLATGSVYAMIALGYTLVYGIIKLINFAHGEFYMFGGYIAFYILTTPFAANASAGVFALLLMAAMLASACGSSILAVVTERVAYRPIRRYERIVALLTAIGVSFLLQNIARLVFSPDPRTFNVVSLRADAPDASPAVGFVRWYSDYQNIFGIEIQNAKIVFLIFCAASMILLYFLVQHTRFGKAMRATSQDLDAAVLMGIDTDKVISRTFALGGAFAGLAGMMVGMLRVIDPMMGFLPGLKAFVAAVVGGIGSIPGALIGGLIIGLSESTAIQFIGSGYKDAVAFGLLIVILLFRPGGVMGVKRREKV